MVAGFNGGGLFIKGKFYVIAYFSAEQSKKRGHTADFTIQGGSGQLTVLEAYRGAAFMLKQPIGFHTMDGGQL